MANISHHLRLTSLTVRVIKELRRFGLANQCVCGSDFGAKNGIPTLLRKGRSAFRQFGMEEEPASTGER